MLFLQAKKLSCVILDLIIHAIGGRVQRNQDEKEIRSFSYIPFPLFIMDKENPFLKEQVTAWKWSLRI